MQAQPEIACLSTRPKWHNQTTGRRRVAKQILCDPVTPKVSHQRARAAYKRGPTLATSNCKAVEINAIGHLDEPQCRVVTEANLKTESIDTFIEFLEQFMLQTDRTDRKSLLQFYRRMQQRVDNRYWPRGLSPESLAERFSERTRTSA
jgi:hypothetical protein